MSEHRLVYTAFCEARARTRWRKKIQDATAQLDQARIVAVVLLAAKLIGKGICQIVSIFEEIRLMLAVETSLLGRIE